MTTISVVLPVFNRAHCVAEALRSVLFQTVPAEEVVVVDEPTADAEAADEMEAVDADAAAGGEPTDSPLERLPAPLAKLLLPHDQQLLILNRVVVS